MREAVTVYESVNGIRLWWQATGRGQDVVLIPGGPGLASDYLDPLVDLLADTAHVIQWDPRGCGRSESSGPFALTTWLEDLDALRRRAEVDRCVLVGHSAGACLGLAYALEYTDIVHGLVCIAGGSGVHDDRQWHAAYEAGVRAARDPAPATRFPVNGVANAAGNASWREYIKQPRLLRRLSELPVPLLAIHGTEDIRPGWPMRQLAELVPRGAYVEVDGADHMPWTTHRREVREAVLTFLQQLA